MLSILYPALLLFTFLVSSASVYTVVCLSIERLLHIHRPQWSDKVDKETLIFMHIVCGLVAFLPYLWSIDPVFNIGISFIITYALR